MATVWVSGLNRDCMRSLDYDLSCYVECSIQMLRLILLYYHVFLSSFHKPSSS
jgi:hypothetical protein